MPTACQNRHIQAVETDKHCSRCGAPTISRCSKCNTPLRFTTDELPNCCYECGQPFPWSAPPELGQWWGKFFGLGSEPRGDVLGRYLTLVGIVFVAFSAISFARAARNNTVQIVYSQSQRISRFFGENEGLRKYFYADPLGVNVGDISPESVTNDKVWTACEMLCDFYTQAYQHRYGLAHDDWNTWWNYMCDTYDYSPVVRHFMKKHKTWYDPIRLVLDNSAARVTEKRSSFDDVVNSSTFWAAAICLVFISLAYGRLLCTVRGIYPEIPILVLAGLFTWARIELGMQAAVIFMLVAIICVLYGILRYRLRQHRASQPT